MDENYVAECPDYMQGLDKWEVSGIKWVNWQTNKDEDSTSKEITFNIQRDNTFSKNIYQKDPFWMGLPKKKKNQKLKTKEQC